MLTLPLIHDRWHSNHVLYNIVFIPLVIKRISATVANSMTVAVNANKSLFEIACVGLLMGHIHIDPIIQIMKYNARLRKIGK